MEIRGTYSIPLMYTWKVVTSHKKTTKKGDQVPWEAFFPISS